MDLVPHYVDHEQALGCLGPVVIRVISSAGTEFVDADRFSRLAKDILQRAPAAGLWAVVHHGAPVPDSSVRRYMGNQLKPFSERLCIVTTMLGLGFWASAATAATHTIAKFTGTGSRITTTVEAGAQRLCMDLIGLDPARLVAAYDQLLARIGS